MQKISRPNFPPRLRIAVLAAAALFAGHSWAQTTAAQQGSRNPNNPPPNSAPTPGAQPSKPLPTANAQQSQARPLPTANAQQSSPNPSTPPNPPGTQPPPPGGQPTPSAMPDLFVRNYAPSGAVPGLPGTGPCEIWNTTSGSKQLRLLIGNNGATAAPAHTNTVVFHNATGSERVVTWNRGGASAGVSNRWSVNIPASAWSNGQAHFTATVDSGNVIVEGYEGNNTLTGFCQGPAG